MYRGLTPDGEDAAGRTVLDGEVTWFPRPHRDDVLLSVIGLTGGALLWVLGLHNAGHKNLLPDWTALVPLVVMASMELLRRSMPRTTLLVGTLATARRRSSWRASCAPTWS
ncbi:hypothetical protein [Streptomyces sp. H27-C3]|uniref:hypothetical protein n=1 Tax=Streptomyces sp. H27-C3 TaxID=3046305 RepID=UPI0032D92377